MKKIFLLLLLVPFLTPVQAQDESDQAVQAREKLTQQDKRAIQGEEWDGQYQKQLEKGASGSPGAHGQANAYQKRASNPGQGGGKNKGLEGEFPDDLIDESGNKKGGKANNKSNKKSKKKR